jgi:lactose/L-arabinose transport system substrate-binding protein
MKLRKLLVGVLSLVMVLSLAACGGGSSDDSSGSTGDGKITIWAWDENFNIKAAQEAKELYLKDNSDLTEDDIEVVTMAQDDIVQKLNTALSSGTYDGLPDIVLIEDYRIQGYLNSYPDEFASLSDVVNIEDFATYKTQLNVVDGEIYGMPFDSGVAACFYRKDLVEQAGYTEADMENLTWDKYIEIGKAVKEKTGVNWCTVDPSDIGTIRMMMQSASTWYTDDEGNVNFKDNQGLKDAITTYKKLVDAGITTETSSWDQYVGAFNDGKVASVSTGCWIAPSIKSAEDQSGKWAVAEYPKMAENSASVNASSCGGAGWYVLKNVADLDLSKDFLAKTFGSSTELMNQLAEDISLVSTLNAASECENYQKGDEYFSGQEVFGILADLTADVPAVNYGANTYALEDLMCEAVQKIVSGADMDQTLADYQEQAEAAIAQ